MRTAFLLFAIQTFALALSAQANSACKEVTIVGPAGITAPGGTIILKVKADTPLPANAKYEWSVSVGTIVSGQGTESIEVLVPSDGSVQSVNATLRVEGLHAPCNTFASEEYGVAPPLSCGLVPDEWGKLNKNDERARLFNAGVWFSQNPKSVLVFVIYLAPNESSAQANRRAEFIRNFFLNDKIIKSSRMSVPFERLHVVFARSDDTRTAVYIFLSDNWAPLLKSFNTAQRPEELKRAKY
jgi:hypothetical protein